MEAVLGLMLFLVVAAACRLLIETGVRRRVYDLHRAAFMSLEDQVAVLDNQGNIIDANGAWRLQTLLGHTIVQDALPGTNYLVALGTASQDNGIIEALRSVLSYRCPRKRLEYVVRTPDGVCWVEHSIQRLQRPEGGAVLVIADVTPRKEAEREAQEMRDRLARLSREVALSEICAAIAHETNQPLSAILGNAEAAIRRLAVSPVDLDLVREIMRDIIAESLRASDVINHVRVLLRNGETRFQPLELNTVVAGVLGLLRTELTQCAIMFQTDLAPDIEPVRGDAIQLQQAIFNLVLNACEAMDKLPLQNRRLHIRTRNGAQGVELAIKDCGPGIPPADCEMIFRPFITTKARRLGLGLSISRSIVRAHGGRLWAECAEPGALFRMMLPRSSAQD